MNWLKANWFKISISVGVLLLGFGAVYYFVFFLPKITKIKLDNQQAQNLFNKNLDCQKYQKQVQDTETGFLKMTVMSGIFYSTKINSCLYAGLDWDNKIKIKDAITGQDIFSEELKDMKLGGTVGEEIKAQIQLYK